MQVTIQNPISCCGIGVHSGKVTQLTLKPAGPDVGVVFIRTDVTADRGVIDASYDRVSETALSTSIANEYGVQVSTIEHLMAAVWGCGVDNLIVELDGPEVPIMDGSSKPFVFMLECASRKLQNTPKKYLKILKEIRAEHHGCEIIATPSDKMLIDLTVEYSSKAIGRQSFSFAQNNSFQEDVAGARTFGFVHELEYLKSKGLAQGASLDNAIGIDQDTILNHDGLRYPDEFVRHKLLDLLGDLSTARAPIIGAISGYKTGHALNNEFLRRLFSDPANYTYHAGAV